jgi:protein-arginine kinase activator protein McsA
MNIEREVEAIEALRSKFADVIAHGETHDGQILVSLDSLRQLKEQIDMLHEDLHEAALAQANDAVRRSRG